MKDIGADGSAIMLETQDISADLSAIDERVRKLDEEKIKDYKDDIDTLLVFVGFYLLYLTCCSHDLT